jgi:LysM repeat protein
MKDLLDIETWIGALRNSSFRADRHLKNTKDTLLTLSDSLILGAHRVKEGETLYSISETYYSSPFYINDLISFNKLTSATVTAGQILSIPRRKV